MIKESLINYYEFSVETAYQAGRLTLGSYQVGVEAEYKPDDSPVTVADRMAEEYIRSQIEKHFPKHAIVGEEFSQKETESHSHRWLIDPIDGTKAFLRGVPLFGVLIGLEIEGKVEVGAVYFPALDEIVAAASGLGCWWNGRRAHVSTVNDLSRAWVVSCTDKNLLHLGKWQAWEHMLKACYYQSGWGDAYGYLLVATGRAEVMLDAEMDVWDCGPFPPILSEAGGYFGDWKGNPGHRASEALATNGILLPQLLGILG
jgi:myo-inositol-1(or 4)-monophosphatase